MAEEIKIVIGADVNQAISNIGKFNGKLGDTDDIVASVIGSSKDLDDALDKLGKQGLLSFNALQQSISEFKRLLGDATDPEDIKKLGDGITALVKRQQELITGGAALEKSHASQSASTQRLSSSFLNLGKLFEALPPEVAHFAHSFDQIFESFEKVGHGSETTGEKVGKFAGVLGQVGLGLAISVAVGLLADFVKGLLDSDAALEQATEEGARFANKIDEINGIIEDSKANLKFIKELGDINIDINFGKGFTSDLLKGQAGFVDLQSQALKLQEAIDIARETADEAFKSFQEGVSDDARAITSGFSSLSKVPESLTKSLSEVDKKLIDNVKATGAALLKAQKELADNEEAQTLQSSRIRQTRSDKEREDEKKKNDDLKTLLESRANIIKEFTAKFASIKDPFPDFFTKNLPLGKVEDKALRAALDNAFKLLSKGFEDLRDTKKIDPGTIPIEIKFKPEIIGKTELVREIEDKFGDISKDVENAVNKGIFEVPVDFRIAPEGDGQALKVLEDRINKFVSDVEGLTGQRDAILNINSEFLATLDEAKARDEIRKIEDLLKSISSGIHPVVKIDAKGDVKIDVDAKKIGEDLAREINTALETFASDAFVGFGESLGDALSQVFNGNGAKAIFTTLQGLLSSVGKALIKAGVLYSGIGKALKAFAAGNPAIAIALGVALVALSKVLANSIQGAREKGGAVQGGFSYLVNEKGKEIFAPNSGQPYWIEGGPQIFKPKTSGKIVPAPLTASFAKMFADRFKMPKFADGGIVTGPVFGLLGEGSGISSINPEVIAPLETLKNLLPGFKGNSIDVRVTGSISNRVIKLGQARQGRSDSRNS